MKTISILKKITLVFLAISLFNCSDDDDATMDTIKITKSDLIGEWTVTSMTSESGDDLLPACNDGKMPKYVFTEEDNLNTVLYSISDTATKACEASFVFYSYSFNTDTNIITITPSSDEGYKTKIIQLNENSFTTQYVSGTTTSQSTSANFKTVFERI